VSDCCNRITSSPSKSSIDLTATSSRSQPIRWVLPVLARVPLRIEFAYKLFGQTWRLNGRTHRRLGNLMSAYREDNHSGEPFDAATMLNVGGAGWVGGGHATEKAQMD
jgi:hypothetical protein